MTNTITIAHRGASGYAPENTLLSFRKAYDLRAEMVELDVHETLDGVLVCIHDSTLDRTTNGHGVVHDFTYKELQTLDAGEGERIPLLIDVFKYASGKLKINTELKVIGVEQKILDMAHHCKMMKDIIVSSFYHGTLATIRNLNDMVETAILVNKPMNELVDYALEYKANAINPHHSLITPALVRSAHEANLKVYPWTVNDKYLMKQLLDFGIDGLITDFPDRATNLIRTHI
ncbi:MAG: glycerophosphodiester phosphodiesterase [Candidatus Sifarchaeia archaeon]